LNFYTNVHLHKADILLRGYKDGERVQQAIRYNPYLFEPNRVYRERGVETPFKTLKGEPVYKREFDSVYEAREHIKTFRGVAGKPMYGLDSFVYTFINDNYPGEIDYDPKLISLVSLDIEVDSEGGFPDIALADRMVTAITLRKKGQSLVFGLKEYAPESDNVTYIQCKDEHELLNKFLTAWQSKHLDPDVVTGWNIEFFDIPYLVNRIRRQMGDASAKRLSPWGILDQRTLEIMGKEYTIFTPVGVNIIDYMQAYKKFSFAQQESFKLDHIAFIELGERKLDYVELGFETLDEFYKGDYQNYINYNIRDVELVDKLEDKLKFLEQIYAIAYDGKCNYSDSFTSVRMWDIIIHNYLLSRGIVVPIVEKGAKDSQIVGAYVKDPQVGMHKWVVSFDLNSLYPHLIMQYNISPETYVEMIEGLSIESILDGALNDGYADQAREQNRTIAASGCMFDRDYQGFLPTLMQKMYNDRVKFKKQMLAAKQAYEKDKSYEIEKEIARCHNMQLAKKIQLNSAYGALSNIYFRWFNRDLAESITKSGQLSIRWMERKINAYLNKQLKTGDVDYVIACDTDSMYLDLGELVNQTCEGKSTDQIVKYLDTACEKIFEPFINKSYEELAQYVNAYDQKMVMKREAIADKGIWTAKKRYILNVYNNEGVQYTEPKLKLSGIEAVRSSTPSACRDNIKAALKLIMTSSEDDLIAFIANFREEFKKLPFEQIAFPRSVRGLSTYYDSTTIYRKSTPIHVRGALIYNHMLKKNGLQNKYQAIGEGEKIKFCFLKVPNIAHSNIISTPGSLPKELDLLECVDYDTQFEKSFIDPLQTILDVLGWHTEKQVSLESFF
jgi:DNA polymerase elongation subunit (family B)